MKIYLNRSQLAFLLSSSGLSLVLAVAVYSNFAFHWFPLQAQKRDSMAEIALIRGRTLPLRTRGIPLQFADVPDVSDRSLTAKQKQRILALKEDIRLRHHVDVIVFTADALQKSYGVEATAYPARVLERALVHLDEWLAKYPKEYIATIGLNTIFLFDDWQYEGVNTSGFHLDEGVIGMTAKEHVLHHELWHVADYNIFGHSGDNVEWNVAKFGSPESIYENELGIEAIENELYGLPRPTGFASTYGKFGGPDEDQATTAELLFSNPGLASTLIKEDETFAKGVAYVKDFFYTHSSGQMDEEYWQSDALRKL